MPKIYCCKICNGIIQKNIIMKLKVDLDDNGHTTECSNSKEKKSYYACSKCNHKSKILDGIYDFDYLKEIAYLAEIKSV